MKKEKIITGIDLIKINQANPSDERSPIYELFPGQIYGDKKIVQVTCYSRKKVRFLQDIIIKEDILAKILKCSF